jgi:hypothetical protein
MKNLILPVLGTILLCSMMSSAQEIQCSLARPDGQAPISVMGSHIHHKGAWMFSARSMNMFMKGNLSGTTEASNETIYTNHMIAPQEMKMTMTMIGVMYAPSDFLTLMAMGKYTSSSMDLRTKMGADFTPQSSGLGDVQVTALVKIFSKNRQSIHGNIGVSIPSGSIDQRDDTPMMMNASLAYPMQLGSGTWDPSIALTYLGQTDKFSWGVQPSYKFRIGENSESYTFGNRLNAVAWGAIILSDMFSLSASLTYVQTDMIDGADADLNPMMMPLFNTINSGRSQLDAGVGVNFYVPSGKLKDFRVGVEVKLPVYQDVMGIQMKNTLAGTLGIQYVIGH